MIDLLVIVFHGTVVCYPYVGEIFRDAQQPKTPLGEIVLMKVGHRLDVSEPTPCTMALEAKASLESMRITCDSGRIPLIASSSSIVRKPVITNPCSNSFSYS